MKCTGVLLTLALLMLLLVFPLAVSAQLMIIGNDEKVIFDDAGVVRFFAPGKDTVSIVDISAPESPKIIANLPLENSVFGPPTNGYHPGWPTGDRGELVPSGAGWSGMEGSTRQ